MLPAAFLDRLAQIVPPDALATVTATFAAPVATGFRLNPLRGAPATTLAALEAAGLTPTPAPHLPLGFTVPAAQRAALLAHAATAEGRVYVQNLASQVPPYVLAPQPGERVLDLCAAPGSKTGQLAALVGAAGVTAVEVVRDRFFRLRANLAAQGAAGVQTVLANGAALWHRHPEAFDAVLLDAPCSTEGRFRVDDRTTFAYWSPRKIKEMQAKQQKLLFSALQAVRPGGVVVYSTCTFAPEENEAVLEKALRTFGDAVTVAPLGVAVAGAAPPLTAWHGKRFSAALADARRVLPALDAHGETAWEAFFVAKLVKHRSTLRGR